MAPNWSVYAKRYLIARHDVPFDPAVHKDHLRCVMINNYPCIKQRRANWPHTPGPTGQDGAHDGADETNGHAIFDHPKWSIIADLRWFERNTKGGGAPKSALALAEIYMPWCDTLGSVATRRDESGTAWGKSCPGKVRAPPGFKGPMCAKPATGAPSKAQQQACNDPMSAARTWTRGLGVSTTETLALFDSNGHPTPAMLAMIANVVINENGRYTPNAALLAEAAAAFEPEVVW